MEQQEKHNKLKTAPIWSGFHIQEGKGEMPVSLSKIAQGFHRRRVFNNPPARIIPTIVNNHKLTMREKILEFGQGNIPKRVLAAVRAIDGAGCDKGDITLFDVHKEEYLRLLSCKTLKEAKGYYSEFQNIKETKANTALELLQTVYGGKKFGVRFSPRAFRRLQEKLNFPIVNEKYMDYITQEYSGKALASNLSFMA